MMSDQQSNKSGKRTSDRKRKYSGKGGSTKRNPKRGPPGILLTCETGREFKCRNEGLDIINHYFAGENGDNDEKDETSLSLEEELKMLKSRNKKSGSSRFDVYETGVYSIAS